MKRIDFHITVLFDHSDFDRLSKIKTSNGFLLPQDVRIDEVVMHVNNNGARLEVMYFGRKPDGTEHQRRTTAHIGIQDINWLWTLFPAEGGGEGFAEYDRIRFGLDRLWPRSTS